MPTRTLSIRLAVQDHETVKKALINLGDEGQRALRKIENQAKDASGGLKLLDQASKEGQSALQGYASRLGPVGNALAAIGPGGAAAAAGVAALVAAGAGLLTLANRASVVGDQFQKMSLRTGVSVENLSTLKFAVERSGASLEQLEKGLLLVSQRALDASRGSQEAKASFSRLGVQVTDNSGKLRPNLDLMLDIADAFKGLSSDTERAALAQKIFGESGVQLVPLLREGKAGIQALQAEARSLGGEFSTQAANDAAAYRDALTDMNVALEGLGHTLGVTFLPLLTDIANGFASAGKAARSARQEFLDAIKPTEEEITRAARGDEQSLLDIIIANRGQIFDIADAVQRRSAARDIASEVVGPFEFTGPIAPKGGGAVRPAGPARPRIAFDAEGAHLARFGLADLEGAGIDSQTAREFARIRQLDAEMAALSAEIKQVEADLSDLADPNKELTLEFQRAMREAERAGRGVRVSLKEDIVVVGQFKQSLQSMIDAAKASGNSAMLNFLLEARNELEVSEEADLIIPLGNTGSKAGKQFEAGFKAAVSEGFALIIQEQDFLAAAEGVGHAIRNQAIKGVSDALAEKTTAAAKSALVDPLRTSGIDAAKGFGGALKGELTSFFKGNPYEQILGQQSPFVKAIDTALPLSEIGTLGKNIGDRMGVGMVSGLTTFMQGKTLDMLAGGNIPDELILGVSVAQGALEEFAPEGSVGQSISGAVSETFKIGILGAGIGRLIGDEITAQRAAIGAAIGGAVGFSLGGTVGAQIGSGIGSIAGTLIDKLTGDDKDRAKERAALGDVATDISAFGGVRGFVERIGGPSGFTGARGEQFDFESVQDFFAQRLRLELGLTKDQAEKVLTALRTQGRIVLPTTAPDSAEAEFRAAVDAAGLTGLTGGGLTFRRLRSPTHPGPAPPVTPQPPPAGKTDPGTGGGGLKNIVETVKKAAEIVAAVEAPPPPPPAPKPVGPGVPDDLVAYLATNVKGRGKLSLSRLQAAGRDQVGAALRAAGINPSSLIGEAVRDLASTPSSLDRIRAGTGGVDMFPFITSGIDIVAAQGFSGVVRRPTTFLAGEAGPEAVEVTPLRGAATAEGRTASGEVHVHIGTIETPNVQSIKRWVQTDLMPLIISELKRASFLRTPIMSDRALIRQG